MGSGGSLRHHGGISGPLPLGTLHQSLPRHHTIKVPQSCTITTTTTPSTTATNLGNVALSSLAPDEESSYKSFSRDSGHGGSEQEDSPRTNWINSHQRHANSLTADLKNAYMAKINNLNNSLLHGENQNHHTINFPHIEAGGKQMLSVPNSYTSTLSPGGTVSPALAAVLRTSNTARSHSPWNHTYMEIETEADPVYEEIERERWGRNGGCIGSEIMQVSDLSDEDIKRGTPSDMSRQSSRSYGDSRPLLSYYHQQQQKQIQQQQQLQQNHHYNPHDHINESQFALSEERLRDFNAAQMSRDLEQLQQQLSRENLMTVAVLNGEQVVCQLSSPSHPQTPHSLPVIHESNCAGLAMIGNSIPGSPTSNGYPAHLVVSKPHFIKSQQFSEC